MSKPSTQGSPERDCVENYCRSTEQGALITATITKRNLTDNQIASYINSICHNYGQILDHFGRTSLHIAASCGYRDLCCWLLKSSAADINAKDLESGYTPLHRSIFYGQIHVAVTLMQLGANPHIMDKDDLQPFDHAMKDRLSIFSVDDPCQVYVWGVNNNYTLGTENQHSKTLPDLLEFFRKSNISIKQVAMDKFHSVFVSHSGKAWACGHGQGGRLGLDNEKTVLKPLQIRTGVELISFASVGKDHTVLLMKSGMVYTCGLNTYHVLGHNPPPSSLLVPRPIHTFGPKTGIIIIGTSAARFHTVLWTSTAVYTCGLHAGQLGHNASPEKTIISPKVVVGLGNKDVTIVDVAASDGATVIALKRGDIFVLHQYQTRKIASRLLNIVKVAVVGGDLNAQLENKEIFEKGGEELKILVLMKSGHLLFWQESYPQLTRCIYPLKRHLTFTNIAMNKFSFLLTTKDGEGYQAEIKPSMKKKTPVIRSTPSLSNDFNTFLSRDDCRHLKLTRIPHVHRAVSIFTDPKGRNFSVIQSHPKANYLENPTLGVSEMGHDLAALLEESHEDDTLHDIVFEIEYTKFSAHRYILSLSSKELAALPEDGSSIIKLKNIHPFVFQQILFYIYTGDCQLLHPGLLSPMLQKQDILKEAFEFAKKYKLDGLVKRLQSVRYEEGKILLKDGCMLLESSPPQMERKLFPEYYDVKMASNDGAIFKAHKCVMAARLEYFHSMLAGNWIESGQTNINLPFSQVILRLVLDFLYTDSAPELLECEDIDHICCVLIAADHLFIPRLIEVCEIALSNQLNLRNAANLLQLAFTYNTNQLREYCMHFICLNLTAMLENRTLETISSHVLEELSKYYRYLIPAMEWRVITPYSNAPSDEEVLEAANLYPVQWQISRGDESDSGLIQKYVTQKNQLPNMNKKKSPRTHKSSINEMQHKRYSYSDLDSSAEIITQKSPASDLEKCVEGWIKVDKTQKTVQNRLKVISTAHTLKALPSDYIRLVPQSQTSLTLDDVKEFPQLSSQVPILNTPPRMSWSIDIKKSPAVKLSQKQRKKLASESSDPGISPSPPARAWTNINQSPEYSFVDIMKQTKFGSPSNLRWEK
uniref:BTB domain-containing protein n=1 Tax=Clastoptera arizonana TaxID=38151 RepID=A0A1B6DWT5_9HEMI